MYRTVFWTLWERARVGWFGRMALKHVCYHMWNRSPVQVQCMIQDAWGWCTGMTQRDGTGREVGGSMYVWVFVCVWEREKERGLTFTLLWSPHYEFVKMKLPLAVYCTKVNCLTSQMALVVKNSPAKAGDIRDVGRGFRMGYTCTSVADSCQCMAKPPQYCN